MTLLLSLTVRWVFLVQDYTIPDADQAVVGLMAQHVLLGERPLFFWGQPYTGSVDAYVTAALFALFGREDLLLHIAPLAASVLFVLLTVLLTYWVYGLGIAALTAAYLSLAPNLLVTWSLWAGSGYLEVMALGAGAFLLALPARPGKASHGSWRLPLSCFLLGVGFWLQPIAVFYLLGLLVLCAGRAWTSWRVTAARPRLAARAALCTGALLLGMAPLLVFNLQQQGATLSYLAQRGNHLDYLTVLLRAVFWAAPVIVGTAPSTTSVAYFTTFVQSHLLVYLVGLGAVLWLLWRAAAQRHVLFARLRRFASSSVAPDLALLVLVAANLAAFLSSSWGAEQWSATQPRYLLPLYGATPLLLRIALPTSIGGIKGKHWLTAGALMLGLCGVNLFVASTAFSRPDPRPLAAVLESRHIPVVYGDYWTIYPLMYVSDERIIGVAVREDLGNLHNNRYSPYLRTAAASRHIAWVVQTGSTLQASLLRCFVALHSTYTAVRWRDQTIYDRPTGHAFPWWNGGRCPQMP